MINKSQTPRTLLYKLDIPRHRPICGLRSHCPTTQALICETPSPRLLLVCVARSSIPKMLQTSASLSSIIGDLVEKKRRKSELHRHN